MVGAIENPKIRRITSYGGDVSSENGDRLSSLPDPIIHHIFSYLETIDIIRASAVSRKWRYLWLSMPYLNLDINTVWSDPLDKWPFRTIVDKFKEFVNWVLMSRDGSIDITKFHLFGYNYPDDSTLYRWINIVARRNVQELFLNIISYSPFELPRYLMTCESLVSLKLCFDSPCILKLPASAGFSKLKSLDLLRAEFSDYSLLQSFLLNSPLLEDLVMEACIFRDFEMLDISSSSLKNLIIHNAGVLDDMEDEHSGDGLHNCELMVACPNLVSFSLLGPSAPDYFFEDLNSLHHVYIHLESKSEIPDYEECTYEICKILEGICITEVLKLSLGSLEFLDAFATSEFFSISFDNLKSLTILVGMDERHLQSLITLLNRSPNLEALTIYFEWCDDDDWEIPEKDIPCLTYNLKTVELFEVEGNDNELELMRFLLKNGQVLQKMKINWVTGHNDPGEIIPKLKKFPRSSTAVVLTFLEPRSDVQFHHL